jgi:predicted RNase H-like HicB family nuclease
MNYYSFEILIEKEPEDEGYYAYSPTLPGCCGAGKTIERVDTVLNVNEQASNPLDKVSDA